MDSQKPNLFCHAFPETWGDPHEIKLLISHRNRKALDALPRGKEGTRSGIVVYDGLTRSYWAVRRFPCFIDSFDCCCAAQACKVDGRDAVMKWPAIEFPDIDDNED